MKELLGALIDRWGGPMRQDELLDDVPGSTAEDLVELERRGRVRISVSPVDGPRWVELIESDPSPERRKGR